MADTKNTDYSQENMDSENTGAGIDVKKDDSFIALAILLVAIVVVVAVGVILWRRSFSSSDSR